MNKAMGKSCGVRLLAICVVVTLLAGGAVADGTIYIGTGKGNNGDIVVSVDYSDGVIHSVEVVSHSETPGICDKPIAEIPAAICAANSPDVDTITSATNTSKGIIAAVKDALAQAGAMEKETSAAETWNTWGGLQDYRSTDNLEALWNKKIEQDARAELTYAPKVKTLANGVKVQSVPYDRRHWNTYVLHAEERGCYACHDLQDALENLAIAHPVINPVGDAQIVIDNCINCHDNVYYGLWGIKFFL